MAGIIGVHMEALWLREGEWRGTRGTQALQRTVLVVQWWLDFISHLRLANIVGQSSRPRLLCMLALSRVSLAILVGSSHSIRTVTSQLHKVFKDRIVQWDHSDKELMCK